MFYQLDFKFRLFRTGIFLLCLQPTIAGIGTNAAYASITSPVFTICKYKIYLINFSKFQSPSQFLNSFLFFPKVLLMFLNGMPLNERPAHENNGSKETGMIT